MARYMTNKEREALAEFNKELLDSLKELKKKLTKRLTRIEKMLIFK